MNASLPRLSQHYSADQRAAVVQYFTTLPLDELRRRQQRKQDEIGRAYARRDTALLESLRIKADLLTAAVAAQLDQEE